jgi:hypothetical protein
MLIERHNERETESDYLQLYAGSLLHYHVGETEATTEPAICRDCEAKRLREQEEQMKNFVNQKILISREPAATGKKEGLLRLSVVVVVVSGHMLYLCQGIVCECIAIFM